MIKRIILFLFLASFALDVNAEELSLKMSGKILLQVEDKGQAWYVNPKSNERAYLGRPNDAFRIMREMGLGVSEKDFYSFASIAPSRLSGRILIRAQAKGEAYYVDTQTLKLHYLGRPSDAFRIMRELGLGISDLRLSEIKIDEKYKESQAKTKHKLRLYSFYSETCPHCQEENIFLEELKKDFDNIEIIKYETWTNEKNKALYDRVKEAYGLQVYGVPLLIIGEESVYGYSDFETTGKRIREIVERQSREGSSDLVFPLEENVYQVVKVVDGDTLDLKIEGETKRIRIIGIDTPEIVDPGQAPECFGQEASDEAKKILNYQYVKIESDESQDDTDKYGRLLRHIFLAGGLNFAKHMVENGFAIEYTYKIPSKYQSEYTQAEKIARDGARGMWADESCVILPETNNQKSASIDSESDIFISYIFYDGVEGDNEADEYVVLKNQGETSSLNGFSISDKSGKRYVFPNISITKNSEIKLFSGCGENTATSLYWCYTDSAIWNNGEDTAYLKNSQNELVATYSY